MIDKLKKIALDNKFNTYFLCVGDKDYNIEKVEVVPGNPNCNCYSVAKAFTVFAIGLLYDQKKISMDDLIVDVLKKYLPLDMDEKWKRVRIHDVLRHKVGFGCGILDIDCEDASLYETTDYLKKVFIPCFIISVASWLIYKYIGYIYTVDNIVALLCQMIMIWLMLGLCVYFILNKEERIFVRTLLNRYLKIKS